MTLIEKQRRIYELVQSLQVETKEALVEKGVFFPNDRLPSLDELPDLIRSIYQNDFQWYFNFKYIDQIGEPYIPASGHSIGGLTTNPSIVLNLTPLGEEMNLIHKDPHPIRQVELGHWGHWIWGSDIQSSMKSLEPVVEFNLHQMKQIDDELNFNSDPLVQPAI